MPYLVNKTQTHVSIFEPPKLVPRGGSLSVTEDQANSLEVADAVRLGWLEVSASPVEAVPTEPKFEIESPAVAGSLEYPGAKKEDPAPAPVAEETAEVAPAKAKKTTAKGA